MSKKSLETGKTPNGKKSKIIIGIVSVVALVAIIVGVVFIPQCFAPDFNVDGTYVSEEGIEVVIKDDKISCEEIEALNGELELIKFDTDYARDMRVKGEEMIRFYNLGKDGSIFIYKEDGKTQFGYGDYMFTLQK